MTLRPRRHTWPHDSVPPVISEFPQYQQPHTHVPKPQERHTHTKTRALHGRINSMLRAQESDPSCREGSGHWFTLNVVANRTSHTRHTRSSVETRRSPKHSHRHACQRPVVTEHAYTHISRSHVHTRSSYTLISTLYFLSHLVIEPHLCSDGPVTHLSHSHTWSLCQRGATLPTKTPHFVASVQTPAGFVLKISSCFLLRVTTSLRNLQIGSWMGVAGGWGRQRIWGECSSGLRLGSGAGDVSRP